MIVDKINKYLSENAAPELIPEILASVGTQSSYIFDRQFGAKEERSGGIYLSSIGRCLRQQAYKLLNYPVDGKEIDARARMVFFQGDMAELAVINLAKLSGCVIADEQKEVSINGVLGHIDGTDQNGQLRLLEIKSMSSFGFDKFERGDIDEAYIYQINAYLYALGLDECVMVALNKDSGVLNEKLIKRDNKIVNDIIIRIKKLRQVTHENLPEQAYTPNEKGFYPWQCLYCSYWGHCHEGAEKVLVGKSYKLKQKGSMK